MAGSEDRTTGRRNFLKGVALGSAAITGAAGGLIGRFDVATGEVGVSHARADPPRIKWL
jgi:hypothetical protein